MSGRESQCGQECVWGKEEGKWSAFYECPPVILGSSLPPRLASHSSPSSHSCLVCTGSCCCLGTRSCLTLLQPHGLEPTRLLSPWDFSDKNTGVDSLSLLQGIVPTQGLNTHLPHHRQIFYQLSHKGSPRMLEWVAYPFSSRSSRPRNQTRESGLFNY